MPPIRTPLAKRNGNGHRGPELSEFQRGRIISIYDAGKKNIEIHWFYSHPTLTIRDTIEKDSLCEDGHSAPRSGQPKSWIPAEERRILRYIYRFPKDIYTEIIKAYSMGFKKTTVKKILKLYGIKNWKCKRRPFLTQKNANARLAWCLRYRGRRPEEWEIVVWSDEKRDEWCSRTSIEKWQLRIVQTYGTSKNMKVMVWGAFWDTGRSNLYIMDRDFESAKYGYSAAGLAEIPNFRYRYVSMPES
jgi:hypothetical protein